MEEGKAGETEIVDCHQPDADGTFKESQEAFGNAEKELIFYDSRHRKDFSSLLIGRRKRTCATSEFNAAAVFLLSGR